jgi:hypothetical protein
MAVVPLCPARTWHKGTAVRAPMLILRPPGALTKCSPTGTADPGSPATRDRSGC